MRYSKSHLDPFPTGKTKRLEPISRAEIFNVTGFDHCILKFHHVMLWHVMSGVLSVLLGCSTVQPSLICRILLDKVMIESQDAFSHLFHTWNLSLGSQPTFGCSIFGRWPLKKKNISRAPQNAHLLCTVEDLSRYLLWVESSVDLSWTAAWGILMLPQIPQWRYCKLSSSQLLKWCTSSWRPTKP